MAKQESAEKICYHLLTDIFITGGYSTVTLGAALNDVNISDRAYITRLFYGTIEKSIQFDYIIRNLCKTQPQKPVAILIKMGLYLLRYGDMPDYAAIDKIVSLSKQVGKSGVSGFINAVLRASTSVELPKDNLSIQLSYPAWVIDRLLNRYDSDFILNMLTRDETPLKHIRRNSLKISKDDFEKKLGNVKKTALGYLISGNEVRAFKSDEYTYQAYSSMLAVKAYLSGGKYRNVLDLCAAPGGKAAYLKELCPDTEVVCNDIHPHRVELIKKYAFRMGVKLSLSCADAAYVNAEWINGFDLVVCDVPCSGFGVKAKPDILLNRKEGDIALLNVVQYDILCCAASYVRAGGILCYSTCTIFAEENEDIINKFLNNHPAFELAPICDDNIEENEGIVNLYPAKYRSDGFFVARMKKRFRTCNS